MNGPKLIVEYAKTRCILVEGPEFDELVAPSPPGDGWVEIDGDSAKSRWRRIRVVEVSP